MDRFAMVLVDSLPILSMVSIIIAGAFKAIKDLLWHFKYKQTIFYKDPIKYPKWNQYWNPVVSHRNKWKNGNARHGEKFFGSSTFLVWMTDASHAAQGIQIKFLVLSIVTYTPFIASENIFMQYIPYVAFLIAFTVPFQLSYKRLFKRKVANR